MHNIEKKLDSREVAEMVGKQHKNLLADIRGYVSELAELKIQPGVFFQENTYLDANNQARPCYLITKKGCEFIAHKLTGIKGTEFTAKYINRFHELEEVVRNPFSHLSKEMQAILMHDEKIVKIDERLSHLENEMVIDHEQQQILKRYVNKVVVGFLGGKGSNAYKEISKKVFSECNRDFQNYFKVNSRNNTPKKRFDEAIQYIECWKPCTNTLLNIQDCNAQMSF